MNVQTCPAEAQIRDFSLGNIPESDSFEIAQHLQDCAVCRKKIDELDSQSLDSLLVQLRSPLDSDGFQKEPECQWAIERAFQSSLKSSDEETLDEFPCLPAQLGDYELKNLIARGGMGSVYLAHHKRLGRDVALKVIAGKRLTDHRSIQRFEMEARAIGRLSHPNIVTAMDAREIDGLPVLVMEHVDGLDLAAIVRKLGPLPANVIAAVGRAVAAAIAYANANGLIHRDIKPSNIMISRAGEVKLLDLGLARLRVHEQAPSDNTLTGLTVGTADYMSPEQISDPRNVDIRSDLYSLGCTLYKLLVGKTPYGGDEYATNFAKLAAHVADSPITWPPEVELKNAAIIGLINRLLQKSPESRANDAQEIAIAFEPLSANANLKELVSIADRTVASAENDAEIAGSQKAKDDENSKPPRRPWTWLWAATFGGIPIGIVLGIVLTIENQKGERLKVHLPSNSEAAVQSDGNVSVKVAENKSSLDAVDNSAAGSPKKAKSPSVSSLNLDHAIEASLQTKEPLYQGHPFAHWFALLENERDPDTVIDAARAALSLADTPEQQQKAIRRILISNRTLGEGQKSTKTPPLWTVLFQDEMLKFFPEPLSDLLLAELESNNGKGVRLLEQMFYHWVYSTQNDLIIPKLLSAVPHRERAKTIRLFCLVSKGDRTDFPLLDPALALATLSPESIDELPRPLVERSRRYWESGRNQPNVAISPVEYGMWIPYWLSTTESVAVNPRLALELLAGATPEIQDHIGQRVLDRIEVNPELSVAIRESIVRNVSQGDFFGESTATTRSSQSFWTNFLHFLEIKKVVTPDTSLAVMDVLRELNRQSQSEAFVNQQLDPKETLHEPCMRLRKLLGLKETPDEEYEYRFGGPAWGSANQPMGGGMGGGMF